MTHHGMISCSCNCIQKCSQSGSWCKYLIMSDTLSEAIVLTQTTKHVLWVQKRDGKRNLRVNTMSADVTVSSKDICRQSDDQLSIWKLEEEGRLMFSLFVFCPLMYIHAVLYFIQIYEFRSVHIKLCYWCQGISYVYTVDVTHTGLECPWSPLYIHKYFFNIFLSNRFLVDSVYLNICETKLKWKLVRRNGRTYMSMYICID